MPFNSVISRFECEQLDWTNAQLFAKQRHYALLLDLSYLTEPCYSFESTKKKKKKK